MAESTYAVREGKDGRKELVFPNSAGGITTAVYPFLEPANYQTIFNPANFKGDVRMPTGVDCADFVYAIYCGPEEFRNKPEVEEARCKMKESWLYVPNVNIWTPKSFGDRHGVYVVFDEKGLGTNFIFDQNELETRLSQGEEVMPGVILANGVGFAHRKTYKCREQTPEELARNGYMVLNYTLKGAEKLAEVSTTFSRKSYAWIVDNPIEVVKSVSGLDDNNNRIGIDGNNDGCSSGAFSFGVCR